MSSESAFKGLPAQRSRQPEINFKTRILASFFIAVRSTEPGGSGRRVLISLSMQFPHLYLTIFILWLREYTNQCCINDLKIFWWQCIPMKDDISNV